MKCGISLSLSRPIVRKAGGGSAYTRTAFVDGGGNNSTAQLNNIALPWATSNAAIVALAAAYPTQETTLRLLSGASDIDSSASLNILLTNGFTVMSHDAGNYLVNNLSWGTVTDSLLNFIDVRVTNITKLGHVGQSSQNAGTITGDATTVVGQLDVRADQTKTATGTAGTNGTGGVGNPSNPAQPPPASPPTPGSNGGNIDGSAPNDAGIGTTGNRAWSSMRLLGNFTLSAFFGGGGPGGDGGVGGTGGTVSGGIGGIGGDSNALVLEDGAVGGNGGNATSNGGNGGNGGDGGDGCNAFKDAAVTVGLTDVSGGVGGSGGAAGNGGSASGGLGGVGGAGAELGNQGATGSTGSSTAVGGSVGNPGSTGAAGSLTNL